MVLGRIRFLQTNTSLVLMEKLLLFIRLNTVSISPNNAKDFVPVATSSDDLGARCECSKSSARGSVHLFFYDHTKRSFRSPCSFNGLLCECCRAGLFTPC